MDYAKIPVDTLDSIRRYVKDGVPTGGFLEAVLSNNLQGAVGAADDRNIQCIPEIVGLLYNEAPSRCWGSPEAVEKWLTNHEENR